MSQLSSSLDLVGLQNNKTALGIETCLHSQPLVAMQKSTCLANCKHLTTVKTLFLSPAIVPFLSHRVKIVSMRMNEVENGTAYETRLRQRSNSTTS